MMEQLNNNNGYPIVQASFVEKIFFFTMNSLL